MYLIPWCPLHCMFDPPLDTLVLEPNFMKDSHGLSKRVFRSAPLNLYCTQRIETIITNKFLSTIIMCLTIPKINHRVIRILKFYSTMTTETT